MHEGHRKRMLERLECAEDGFQEHELLEILLYNAIPRKNTNPVAHRLLETFGNLDGVFRAGIEQLKSVEGVGDATAAYLRCIFLCFERVKEVRGAPPAMYNVRTFSAFLTEHFAEMETEALEVYCLDAQGKVKSSKRFSSLRSNRADVAPEEISRLVAVNRPHGIVLAHNHPRTGCRPSERDNKFTAQISVLCSFHRVRLYDHIIVGNDGFYSYCYEGKLDEIRQKYNAETVTGRPL